MVPVCQSWALRCIPYVGRIPLPVIPYLSYRHIVIWGRLVVEVLCALLGSCALSTLVCGLVFGFDLVFALRAPSSLLSSRPSDDH